ncbi:MAG: type IV toxin-antitoxin system AbiEi family antitoxin domain-containing protein [Actinomycetota bacterium]
MASSKTRSSSLAHLSRIQFGALSRAQLLDIGFTSPSLRRAVQRGDLIRVLPSVYRVASVPVTLGQRQMSGILWAGPGAVLCNGSAAQVHGLTGNRFNRIEIATTRRLSPRPGLALRRRLILPGDPEYRVGPLPVTSPARTVLDVCGSGGADEAEVVLDAGLRLEVVTFDELTAVLALGARHRIPGTALLRRLLGVRGEEEAMSESELESLFIRLLRRHGLPVPLRQVTVEWDRCHRLDFHYPEHDLIVEVDGRKWHASKQRFQGDRRRDNEALLNRCRVLWLTWEDVAHDEAYVLATVASALGIVGLF